MEQQPKVEEIVDKEEIKNHTNNPIKEDRKGILIELLEDTTWINKTNIATELAIEENDKKEKKTDKELVPEKFHNYLDILSETDSPNLNLEITRSKWRKDLNQNHSKITTLHQQNRLNWTNSSKRI